MLLVMLRCCSGDVLVPCESLQGCSNDSEGGWTDDLRCLLLDQIALRWGGQSQDKASEESWITVSGPGQSYVILKRSKSQFSNNEIVLLHSYITTVYFHCFSTGRKQKRPTSTTKRSSSAVQPLACSLIPRFIKAPEIIPF